MRVTVWREEVLPGSETFIANQVAAMRRWEPALSGLRARPNPLGVAPRFVVEDGSPALAHRADRWLYWRTGTGPRLHRALRRSALVHAHFGPDGARLLRAARIARRPLLVTFHGYDATVPAAAHGVDYGPLFRHAARLVCVSEFIRGCVIAQGAPTDRTTVLPIGIPVPPPAAGPRRRQVLFVGRLVDKKGGADLLAAAAGLADPPPIEIIGDGALRGELERRAGELRLDVRFRGARPPDEVAEAMARSAVLCVPSRTAADGDREGFGMVFLEAAARGLPAVSYASGGVPEAVLHGETGLLAPEGDTAELARQLAAVLDDPGLGERLGAAGRARVQSRFEIGACTRRLEALYDRLAPASASTDAST